MLDRARQDLDRGTLALHARGERALAATRHQLHQLAHRLAGLHPRARILAIARRSASSSAGSRRRIRRLGSPARVATTRRSLIRRDTAMRAQLDARRAELARLGAQMAALSPLAVLDRGYAMVVKRRRRSCATPRRSPLAMRFASGSPAARST